MNLLWIQLAGVLATFAAAGMTALNAHAANRDSADVAHRTTSLTELEKALTFTGVQLDELRTEVLEQAAQIRILQRDHELCERDKRRLSWEVAGLKAKLSGGAP